MRFFVSAICKWQCLFFIFLVMCMLLYAIGIVFLCWFQHNPFCNCTRTEIWYILTQLGLVITFIFLFLACFYIPLEWEFYAESNAVNHLSIRAELTELWGFLYLPSAYGNVYFLFFIFVICMLLYTIGIAFLCWFQRNFSFLNRTKTDWDMTHTNQ